MVVQIWMNSIKLAIMYVDVQIWRMEILGHLCPVMVCRGLWIAARLETIEKYLVERKKYQQQQKW